MAIRRRCEIPDLPDFTALKTEHAHFHVCAGNVAQKISAGDRQAAEHMISDENSEFNRASGSAVKAILKLKKSVEGSGAEVGKNGFVRF